jgi:hypothetical protein
MKTHAIKLTINGREQWLNNCDGISPSRAGAKRFSAQDAVKAAEAVRSDPRWQRAEAVTVAKLP